MLLYYIFHVLMVIMNLESCSMIHSNCWLDPTVAPYFSIFQEQNLWNIAPRSGCGRPAGARDEYRRPTGARKQQKRVKNGGFDRWIHYDLWFHQKKLGENHVEHGGLVVVELWTIIEIYIESMNHGFVISDPLTIWIYNQQNHHGKMFLTWEFMDIL